MHHVIVHCHFTRVLKPEAPKHGHSALGSHRSHDHDLEERVSPAVINRRKQEAERQIGVLPAQMPHWPSVQHVGQDGIAPVLLAAVPASPTLKVL